MTGFEPRISGVGSDRSTNCATTTAPLDYMFVHLSVGPMNCSVNCELLRLNRPEHFARLVFEKSCCCCFTFKFNVSNCKRTFQFVYTVRATYLKRCFHARFSPAILMEEAISVFSNYPESYVSLRVSLTMPQTYTRRGIMKS